MLYMSPYVCTCVYGKESVGNIDRFCSVCKYLSHMEYQIRNYINKTYFWRIKYTCLLSYLGDNL